MKTVELHPDNPQPRLVRQIVDVLNEGGTIALPTDSGYAVASKLANKDGLETIRRIRHLDDKHNFSLLCESFGQLGELVMVDNKAFRTIKALTPGPYTFILPATKEVPRMTLVNKKKTVGVRLPDHRITQAIVEELGEPLLCSTLILPGETEPLISCDEVVEAVGNEVDIVVDGPVGLAGATTVIDFTAGYPEVARKGAGDTSLFD
ncbi:L-threonylcarbamoyladenylate synthase [Actinomyces minihominis]|uniref:L-threonylcarbamoyladenylate synthase n=1 Tax=Actinomyces minihominis TaxID=2002838 RepID=UPI000C088C87|nr:L-threonylcarbamoyladenylate synthase [Actinomyces minihominis]